MASGGGGGYGVYMGGGGVEAATTGSASLMIALAPDVNDSLPVGRSTDKIFPDY